MKIAVIADIHGNAPALEAVLNDLSRSKVDQVIDLGDAFNGPIDPVGVAELLRPMQMVHIRGNGERMVISQNAAERNGSANFARDRLSAKDLDWIGSWPTIQHDEHYLACHGTPDSDVEYLLEDVTAEGVCLRSIANIRTHLGLVESSLVLCAHSHVPRLVQVGTEMLVMNPGSVGLPAYSLDSPVSHRMEAGSPYARYAIAEHLNSGWRVSHIAVPYDFEKAAAAAEKAGFPDWAIALKTGYVL